MSSDDDIATRNPTKGSPPSEEVDISPPKYSWYHGVFFNATVVGISAFAAPGLWNAMNSVGAGGQQTPYLVMAGNAILFAVMTLTCLTGSMMVNRFGLRNSLVVGTVGYVIYSAALYTNNRYGTEWFIYLGSAVCGLSAGIFWATEGTIILSYPEPEKRGRYLAYWLSYRNSGSILGGIINLAFNYRGRTTGKLDWRTYIVFVALQCLGPVCSLLLTPPEKVVRRNGSRVQLSDRIPDLEELKALTRVLLRKDFLLVIPYFLYVTWELPYISSYLSLYFSVRSRALASLVSAIAQVVTTLAFGAFLDWTRVSLNKRARYGYITMMTLIGGCWIWGAIIQNEYTHHKPALDWDDGGFGRGWALYIFLQINFSLTYNFGFWLIGFLAREPKEIVRYMSLARAAESAGQCISSGISSTTAPLISALGVTFALWGIAVIPAYCVVRQVGVIHIGPERLTPDSNENDRGLERS
ncbi:MFS general substrate transporter [Daldinia vernicosa]|uniref:MFS general substrate transporter n=1 Tax=Daldinia vernicosa TaxID=114800 RepID=UPI002007F49F|nr:MFS general substrate transporter [Daldinia vernicosa]KAI0848052.1 MFS general substrate transporter [Daldinia vernicosa]